MNWLSSAVHGLSFGQIWRPRRFVDDPRDYPAVTARGFANLREQFSLIESMLSDGREWAVPGGFSVADAHLLVYYLWGGRVELDMAADYPAWTRITRRVVARPAVARVLKDEGLALPGSAPSA